MTCKFCGNVIDDNSDICFICGQKVEPEAAPAEAADAFAPVAAAPVAPAAPVYAAAPAAPVYAAAPVAPAAPAAPTKAELKAAKKAAKKEAKANGASPLRVLLPAVLLALVFLVKNLCYVFVAVLAVYLLLVYRSYNKAMAKGDTAKAQKLVNSTLVGACVGMAVACVLLIKTAFVG